MERNGMAWLCVAAAMAVSTMTGALAQTTQAKSPGDALPDFSQLDRNGDGEVSRSEVPEHLRDLRAYFAQYGGGNDHRLSRAEYENYVARVSNAACESGQFIRSASCPARGPASSGFKNVPAPQHARTLPSGNAR
jgi:hypothetical protein